MCSRWGWCLFRCGNQIRLTCPASQFLIEGYIEPYCFDRKRNRGGVLIHVREDIPSKLLADPKLPRDIEGIFLELYLRKYKWLLFGSYQPPRQSDEYFFNNGLDIYSKFYDKYMLVWDFEREESEPCLRQFLL